jgi:hypothetical protein
MRFQEIVSISGLPGLFQLVATKSDGAIVRDIDNNGTKFVAARKHSVTALDGIEVFTTGENVRLFEVFLTFKSNLSNAGEIDLTKADNKALTAYFGKLFPSFDKDRVYTSDMKKMLKWFHILDAKGLIIAPTENNDEAAATEAEPATAEAVTAEGVTEEVVKEKKPRKKAEPKEPKEPKAKATKTKE